MHEVDCGTLAKRVSQFESENDALRESVAWNTEQRAIQYREIKRLRLGWDAAIVFGERLQAENERWKAGYEEYKDLYDRTGQENERLRALNERQQVLVHQARDERDESDSENERLRAALEEHITSGHDHLGKLAAALESDKE